MLALAILLSEPLTRQDQSFLFLGDRHPIFTIALFLIVARSTFAVSTVAPFSLLSYPLRNV